MDGRKVDEKSAAPSLSFPSSLCMFLSLSPSILPSFSFSLSSSFFLSLSNTKRTAKYLRCSEKRVRQKFVNLKKLRFNQASCANFRRRAKIQIVALLRMNVYIMDILNLHFSKLTIAHKFREV